LSDLTKKIVALLDAAIDPELKAEMLIDIVARGLGKLGGRPKKEVSEPVMKPPEQPVSEVTEPVTKPEEPRRENRSTRTRGERSSPKDPPETGKEEADPSPSAPAFPPGKNAFGKALAQFQEIWRTRYGVHYEPSSADRNQLGRLLQRLPVESAEELPRAFRAYLGDLDPFIVEKVRHSLSYFCTSGGLNKYRSGPPKPIASASEKIANPEVFTPPADRGWQRGAPTTFADLIGRPPQ